MKNCKSVLLFFIVLLCLAVALVDGIKKEERQECLKYQVWENNGSGWEALEYQQEMCVVYNINL